MSAQSREKWAGRAKQLVGRMKHKFDGVTYRYRHATAGRGDMLRGKTQEDRGKLRERLAKTKIRIIR
jgi:uncharacterized protein YjbJ (UPF0337 family)